MHSELKKGGFRPDVQGLRGVAVLLVVLYHAGFVGFGGGYIGVDIFFVISGYLITGLLLREIEASGTLNFVDFYARRVRRLVPAATLVLAVTSCIAWLLYSPLELKQFTNSAIATALYFSNFWFAHISTDYLAEGTGANPLLHTWSLGVEEQFYMVWPFLLLAVAKFGPARSLRWRLLCFFLALASVSFGLSLYLTEVDQPWAFFSSPTRAWEFALGGMVALWPLSFGHSVLGTNARQFEAKRQPLRLAVQAMGLVGLLSVLGATAFMSDRTPFPGLAALLPVAGAALVIAAGHLAPTENIGAVLGVRPLRFLGDISYSLYLWHWPVLLFLAMEYGDAGWPLAVVGLSLSLLFSWLTYVLVENPIRFNRALMARARASLVLAAVLLVAFGALAVTLRVTTVSTLASDAYRRYLDASNDVPQIYANDCQAGYLTVVPPDCAFGPKEAATTVVLFGDSHAAQWLPALKILAEREDWRVVLLTKSSCPSMSYAAYLAKFGRPYAECDEWRERAFEKIGALMPSVTILANSSETMSLSQEGESLDAAGWERATKKTLSRLDGLSSRTVIIKDTPWLKFSGPICLSRAAWRGMDPGRACQFDPNTAGSKIVFDIESQSAAGNEQTFMIDMTDAICPSAPCTIERGGLVLYRDYHHLTVSFVEQLADTLYGRLKPIVEGAGGVQQAADG